MRTASSSLVRTGVFGSRIPRVSASSSPWSPRRIRRSSPSTQRSQPSSRSRASTASGPTSAAPDASRPLLEDTLGFEPRGDNEWEIRGEQRGGVYAYDEAPAEPGRGGAGTVHHVAWATTMEEHDAWRERVAQAGAQPTPVIDRYYFRSIYFREPSGVLFELATLGPGFTTDEPLETLGERLALPPDYEALRDRLEDVLTPLPDPRAAWTTR